MTSLSDYGALFRQAYALLHGGRPGEVAEGSPRRPGESLEEFLARTRQEELGLLAGRLAGTEPPPEVQRVHSLLLELLQAAAEADAVLFAQVEAYRCGRFQESIDHSDRLQELVSRSARLDRELIIALREAESERPGTLAELGLGDIVEPPQMG